MPRILVVDDEPLIAMLLGDWLEELGCDMIGPAESVGTALDFTGSMTLDGAILDVTLGHETSYPVAEALRERAVPFAFATGHDGSDLDDRFKGAPLLPKPFDFAQVKAVVAALLERRPGP